MQRRRRCRVADDRRHVDVGRASPDCAGHHFDLWAAIDQLDIHHHVGSDQQPEHNDLDDHGTVDDGGR
jgi:hypothetical protein